MNKWSKHAESELIGLLKSRNETTAVGRYVEQVRLIKQAALDGRVYRVSNLEHAALNGGRQCETRDCCPENQSGKQQDDRQGVTAEYGREGNVRRASFGNQGQHGHDASKHRDFDTGRNQRQEGKQRNAAIEVGIRTAAYRQQLR